MFHENKLDERIHVDKSSKYTIKGKLKVIVAKKWYSEKSNVILRKTCELTSNILMNFLI